MYFHKTPGWLMTIFPNILWNIKTTTNEVFLTFDDGPVPEATPWVLDQLDQFNAKATFFMVGENIARYNDVFKDVKYRNHTVANHTNNHLNGWQTKNQIYSDNISKAEDLLGTASIGLFRPPHGRLSYMQYQNLKNSYKIVMWDVLSGDYSASLAKDKCLQATIASTTPGSIIVFHDSAKAIHKLKYVLPRFLEYFANKDYKFKAL